VKVNVEKNDFVAGQQL